MFLNNLAISWHLLGDSGDYLAVGRSIDRGANGAIKAHERRHKDAKRPIKDTQTPQMMGCECAALTPEPKDEEERLKRAQFISNLSKWENSLNKALIERAREDILKANNGKAPKVIDPFAGGGAIPLEALTLQQICVHQCRNPTGSRLRIHVCPAGHTCLRPPEAQLWALSSAVFFLKFDTLFSVKPEGN